jgi:hypothetical protein
MVPKQSVRVQYGINMICDGLSWPRMILKWPKSVLQSIKWSETPQNDPEMFLKRSNLARNCSEMIRKVPIKSQIGQERSQLGLEWSQNGLKWSQNFPKWSGMVPQLS